MKTAILYVFSGTGNTRAAAEMIAKALSGHAVEATVWNVRVPFAAAPDPNDFDIAGFGYPIHAFNTPQFVLRFAKTLPKVSGRPAFVFKTSGEPFHVNSASSMPLVRLLRKKGFRPMLERHLLMPYNIMFRYPDALAKQMYLHTRDMAELIADNVAGGRPEKLHYMPWTIVWMYLFRLQWFGAWINGPLIHVKPELCTGCGLCVANCPAQNIRMEGGRPHFSCHCTMCMGCAFNCPKDAIRPGFLNPWRVNGAYPFKALVGDKSVPSDFVGDSTKGYFRLFRRYYRRTYAEIRAFEVQRHTKTDHVREALPGIPK